MIISLFKNLVIDDKNKYIVDEQSDLSNILGDGETLTITGKFFNVNDGYFNVESQNSLTDFNYCQVYDENTYKYYYLFITDKTQITATTWRLNFSVDVFTTVLAWKNNGFNVSMRDIFLTRDTYAVNGAKIPVKILPRETVARSSLVDEEQGYTLVLQATGLKIGQLLNDYARDMALLAVKSITVNDIETLLNTRENIAKYYNDVVQTLQLMSVPIQTLSAYILPTQFLTVGADDIALDIVDETGAISSVVKFGVITERNVEVIKEFRFDFSKFTTVGTLYKRITIDAMKRDKIYYYASVFLTPISLQFLIDVDGHKLDITDDFSLPIPYNEFATQTMRHGQTKVWNAISQVGATVGAVATGNVGGAISGVGGLITTAVKESDLMRQPTTLQGNGDGLTNVSVSGGFYVEIADPLNSVEIASELKHGYIYPRFISGLSRDDLINPSYLSADGTRFLKTSDLQILGNIPKRWVDEIRDTFNRGVKIWTS